MLKLRYILIAALAMVTTFGVVTWRRASVDIGEVLIESATRLNADAPKMIDAHTDFIGARADGTEIVYLYRVHGLSAATMGTSKDEMKAAQLTVVNRDDNMQHLLARGVRMSFEYFVGSDLALRFSIER